MGRVVARRAPKPYVRTLSDAAWEILNERSDNPLVSGSKLTDYGRNYLMATERVALLEEQDGFVFQTRSLTRAQWVELWLRGKIHQPRLDGKALWKRK